MLYDASAGSAGQLIGEFSLGSEAWDAEAGPLQLLALGFSATYLGLDSSGHELPSGVYLLVLESKQGANVQEAQKTVVLLRQSGASLSVLVVPNPVPKGTGSVDLYYAPVGVIWAEVYNLAGERLLDLGRHEQGRVSWDLKTRQGQSVATGIYFITLRRDGDRKPYVARMAVLR